MMIKHALKKHGDMIEKLSDQGNSLKGLGNKTV